MTHYTVSNRETAMAFREKFECEAMALKYEVYSLRFRAYTTRDPDGRIMLTADARAALRSIREDVEFLLEKTEPRAVAAAE